MNGPNEARLETLSASFARVGGYFEIMNVLIRDLNDDTVETLKKRASERNRSLQAELKAIVEEAAAQDWSKTWAAADRIFEELRRSGQKFSDTTQLLREDRDR